MENKKNRCFGDTSIYEDYHDNEWRRPVHDDIKLFEMLILEGAQAGLSWITVLKKREAYREAFDGFDPKEVALYSDAKIEELMKNEGIIRNRLKINAAVNNAKLFLGIIEKYGSFDKFIWGYMDYKPVIGYWDDINTLLVLILKEFIAYTGVLEILSEAMAALPLPTYIIFALLFFAAILVSGSTGAIAMGTPLAFAAIPGGMPLMVYLMCIAHAASQLSPTHVCLVVASEYFHVPLGD